MVTGHKDNFAFLNHLPENEMRFHIEGVRCQSCLSKIYELREKLKGLLELHVNMGTKQLIVRIDKSQLQMSEVANEITRLGYHLHPLQTVSESEQRQKIKNRRSLIGLGVAAASTGNIMLLSTANYAGADREYAFAFDVLSFLLFLPSLLYSAQPFWQSFFLFIRTRITNIDLTIITAIILGTSFSVYNLVQQTGHVYFDSMAMLIVLLLASRYLLDRIQQSYLNTNYLTPLLLETAVDVWIPATSTFESRPVKNLVPGDIIQLYKQQSLPIDGQVISEEVSMNTAVITGESLPQVYNKNDRIFAGSVILSDKVQVKVEKVGNATRMGEFLSQLSEQLHSETPLTSKLNHIAKIFTVSIISLALFILIYFAPSDLAEGIQRALALAILACPCALALAIPLTQSLGLMQASRKGIIIKNGNILHEISKIQNFVFDKTGTLTYGEFEFLRWHEEKIGSERDAPIMLALELKARHPVGKTLAKYLSNKGVAPIKLERWKEVFGQGVSGYYENQLYELKAAPLEYAAHSKDTCIGFYKNQQLQTVAYFGDRIRPQASAMIHQLKGLGRVYLLSGDNPNNSHYVAQQVGIPLDSVISSSSPEEKVHFVQSLENCAMIGDGANDAVAISKANIGIAVKGSMAASLKAADVYFTSEGIEHISSLLEVSHLFEKTVRGHMWFSAIYNLVGAGAALLGLINPLIAALLMPASSLTVLFTSLWGMKTLELKKSLEYKLGEVHT